MGRFDSIPRSFIIPDSRNFRKTRDESCAHSRDLYKSWGQVLRPEYYYRRYNLWIVNNETKIVRAWLIRDESARDLAGVVISNIYSRRSNSDCSSCKIYVFNWMHSWRIFVWIWCIFFIKGFFVRKILLWKIMIQSLKKYMNWLKNIEDVLS